MTSKSAQSFGTLSRLKRGPRVVALRSVEKGSGYGTVGRVITSDTGLPEFESSCLQILQNNYFLALW